jgi:DNA-binding transcriptional ArsR family regulator
MGQPATRDSEGRLPAELAAALKPGFRRALDNPTRREILRILHDSEQPRGLQEIADELPDCTVSEVGYHTRVLEQAGGLVLDDEAPTSDRERRRYVSAVAEDLQVLAALHGTQSADRNQLPTVDRRSSRFLTMFRIPRPALTIRLGESRRGRE